MAGIVDCTAVETDDGAALGWAAADFMISAAFRNVSLIVRYYRMAYLFCYGIDNCLQVRSWYQGEDTSVDYAEILRSIDKQGWVHYTSHIKW